MFLPVGCAQPCSVVPLEALVYWAEARTREEVTEGENTKPGKVFKVTNEQTGVQNVEEKETLWKEDWKESRWRINDLFKCSRSIFNQSDTLSHRLCDGIRGRNSQRSQKRPRSHGQSQEGIRRPIVMLYRIFIVTQKNDHLNIKLREGENKADHFVR